MRNFAGLATPFGRSFQRGSGGGAASYYDPFTANPSSGSYVRVDQADSRWQDAAGTVPAVEEDDPVMRLDDLSGNGKHWIWSNAANPPLLRLGGDAPAIETSYSGRFDVTDVGFDSGNDIFVGLSLARTELTGNQGTRYGVPFSTTNSNISFYTDANAGSAGTLYLKSLRTGEASELLTRSNLDSYLPADTNKALVMWVGGDANGGYSTLRFDRFMDIAINNAGNDLLTFGTDYYLLDAIPSLFYGGIVKTAIADEAEREDIEDELIRMHNGTPPSWYPILIPHRGLAGCFPSETLAAYEGCYAAGYSIIDGDVQASADGTPWIFHDATVDTLTDGTGDFSSLTDAYLETLTRDGGGSLITLEELLTYAAGKFDQVSFDIKDKGTYGNTFLATVVGIFEASAFVAEDIFISGAEADRLYIQSLNPDFTFAFGPRGGTMSEDIDWGVANGHAIYSLPIANIDDDPTGNAYAKASGIALVTWTLDSGADLQKAVTYEIDYVTMDNTMGELKYGWCPL